WTLTAHDWSGSTDDRRRRQLYVTHTPQGIQVRNGAAAHADRQMIQTAALRALTAAAGAHRLQQAVRGRLVSPSPGPR
ncbi:hypothetical protein GTY54_46485, partial [Streptomyces sp. SID625]|nr:hypothetical protein [Streptomyces sp. SID625]